MAEEDKKENLKKRLGASIAFETGVGLATDWATFGLLGLPVPGARPLYYGINYAVGAGANIIGQNIRGEEDTNWGEVTAAGGFQTIPFGTTAKGLKGIRQAAIKGSAIAVGGEQVRVGIDEQRFITPGEAVVAGTLGAGFGGTIKFGTESADILIRQARADRLARTNKFWRQPGFDPESPNPIPNPWEDGKTFNRVDTTNREARRQTEIRLGVRNRLQAHLNSPHQTPVPEWGTPRDRYGSLKRIGKDFETFNDLEVSDLERDLKAAIQDPGGTLAGSKYYWLDPGGKQRASTGRNPKWKPSDFENSAKESKRQLEQMFRHLNSGDISIHHLNILDAGAALHENLSRRGQILTRARLFDVSGISSGNNPANARALPGRVHDVAHVWITKNIGKRADKILGKPGSSQRRRWVQLPYDHPERLAKIDEYGALVKQSEEEIARIYKAYNELYLGPIDAKTYNGTFEELLKRLNLTEEEYGMLIVPEGGSSKWTNFKVRKILNEIDRDTYLKLKQDILNQPQADTSVPKVKSNSITDQEALEEFELIWRDRNKKGFRLSTEDRRYVQGEIKELKDKLQGKQKSLFDTRVFRKQN